MTENNEYLYEKRVSNLVKTVMLIVNIFSTGGFTAAFLTGQTTVGMYLLVLASMIVTTVLNFYYSAKHPDTFKYFAVWGYAVVYFVSAVFANNDLLYTLMFCVVVSYILFFDIKLIKAIAWVYGAINVFDALYCILIRKTMHSGDPINYILIFIHVAGAFIFLFALIFVTNLAIGNNETKLSSIKESQSKSDGLLNYVLTIVDKVKENSIKVSEYMDDLTDNVTNTASALREISLGNDNNTQSIEQQTSMTAKIQKMIEDTKGMASDMLNESKDSSTAVDNGRDAIKALTEQAKKNEDANSDVVRTVDKFVESAKLIEASTAEITNIASQTNLLALNASIESARAGEAGKGFAVVATEIGTLATQTNKLTSEINEVVKNLAFDAENAKKSVNTVISVTEVEKDLIEKANVEFNNIGSSVDNLSTNITDIATRIDEIYSANDAIVSSITNISAVSQEVTASTTDAVSLGDKCAENAAAVNGLMKELTNVVNSVNV